MNIMNKVKNLIKQQFVSHTVQSEFLVDRLNFPCEFPDTILKEHLFPYLSQFDTKFNVEFNKHARLFLAKDYQVYPIRKKFIARLGDVAARFQYEILEQESVKVETWNISTESMYIVSESLERDERIPPAIKQFFMLNRNFVYLPTPTNDYTIAFVTSTISMDYV